MILAKHIVVFKTFFKEFLIHGYRVSAEAIDVKFTLTDSTRCLNDFSVRFVDGFTKVLLMMSILCFVEELEFTEDKLKDPTLQATLASFQLVRCSYTHYDNPGYYFLNSLRNQAELC